MLTNVWKTSKKTNPQVPPPTKPLPMKLNNLYLTFLFLFGSFLAALAQGPTLPKVTPSSPSASALGKFGEYPVSLYTGAISVDVPIYTIESDGIKVPIELKYHGSGIRYDDASMAVGIGWTLFAGGMVTYQQQGIPDNTTNKFFKLIGNITPFDDGSTTINDNHSMKDVVAGNKDSEYDTYNFSFLGYSGKFFYPGTTNPVFSPRQNFKVNFNSTNGNFLDNIPLTMVDENGVSYKFGPQTETDMSITTVNAMLTQIVSADKSDTVKFNYTGLSTGFSGSGQMAGKFIIKDIVVVKDNPSNYPNNPEVGSTLSSPGHALSDFSYNRLDNITFKSGKVVFSYDNNNRLTGVTVYNNTDSAPVKVVTVHQTAYGEYYKLDSVRFRDGAMTRSNSYKFEYNGMPYKKISGIDYWGYYNGTAEPLNYTPNFANVFTGNLSANGLANRAPNDTAMLKGILKTVYYPTGGHSVFTFEGQKYSTLNYLAGGARIKSIDNYDATNNFLGRKWYEYDAGLLHKNVIPEDYCYTNIYTVANMGVLVADFDYTMRERTFAAFPAFDSNLSNGSSVTYSHVTEYTGDGTTANGKTEYYYEDNVDQITHVNGGGGGSGNQIPLVARSASWKNGNVTAKRTYKYQSGPGYTLLNSVTNTYKDLNYQEYYNTKILKYLDWQQTSYSNAAGQSYNDIITTFSSSYPVYSLGLTSPYIYANYWLSSAAHVLDSVVTVNDGVSTMTRYRYENSYDKPDSIATRHGDGSFWITKVSYPFNKTGTVYSGMWAANILSPVIDQLEYKTNTSNFLKSTTTNWDSWSGAYYKPLTVSTKMGAATTKVRLRYSGYNGNGDIQTVAKESAPKTTYIWSYKGAYPVAEIQNADYSTVETALGGSTAVNNFRKSNPTDAIVASFLAPLRSASSLAGAMVTTYTYQPLVGVTSTTDPRGQTTYYEYDGYGRLTTIRDMNNNIVKAICYNYKGEATSDCYVPASRNIYARLEYTNPTYTNVPNGSTIDYYTYEDMTIKLYSDATCTQPFSFQTATAVQIKVSLTAFDDVSNVTTNSVSSTFNVTMPANQSSKFVSNQLFQWWHTYYDEYSNFFRDTYDYSPVIVTPTTGNLYVATY